VINPVEGVFYVLISTVDRAMDGSLQRRPVMAMARRIEWQRHGPYCGEATRGLWQAILYEVLTHRGGARWGLT
jgi:hypothetical protein